MVAKILEHSSPVCHYLITASNVDADECITLYYTSVVAEY